MGGHAGKGGDFAHTHARRVTLVGYSSTPKVQANGAGGTTPTDTKAIEARTRTPRAVLRGEHAHKKTQRMHSLQLPPHLLTNTLTLHPTPHLHPDSPDSPAKQAKQASKASKQASKASKRQTERCAATNVIRKEEIITYVHTRPIQTHLKMYLEVHGTTTVVDTHPSLRSLSQPTSKRTPPIPTWFESSTRSAMEDAAVRTCSHQKSTPGTLSTNQKTRRITPR